MNLSDINQGIVTHKKIKRVGRGIGSGHGKTAGRGSKGQYASAGARFPRFFFEGGQMPLFRRIPKRGFSNGSWDKDFLVVIIGDIDVNFAEDSVVDQASLKAVGLARGPADGIRILGEGEITKKISVRVHHVTKSATEKIIAAGGTVEIIPPAPKPVRNKMIAKPPKKSKGK